MLIVFFSGKFPKKSEGGIEHFLILEEKTKRQDITKEEWLDSFIVLDPLIVDSYPTLDIPTEWFDEASAVWGDNRRQKKRHQQPQQTGKKEKVIGQETDDTHTEEEVVDEDFSYSVDFTGKDDTIVGEIVELIKDIDLKWEVDKRRLSCSYVYNIPKVISPIQYYFFSVGVYHARCYHCEATASILPN